jgi:uncharacterized protein (TIGR00290 family)
MKKRTLLSWSSGKDSAWALHVLRQDSAVEVAGLFTSINGKYERASMHATRTALLQLQAESTGLPLEVISLPDPCTNEEYRAVMQRFVDSVVSDGIECMAFGDLFLEDIRQYRQEQLKQSGIDAIFPLWGANTAELADQMLSAGLEAYVSSVDLKKLPARFAGRKWTKSLISEFPESCDPCGENGEIHTIVTAGPMFQKRIPVRVGEILEREGFAYADIVPVNSDQSKM